MDAPYDAASQEQTAEEPAIATDDGAGRFTVSNRLRPRAHALIPGGAHTYAKGDDQYPVLAPGFIARGQGCHVWDVDGNEYIECGMGNRAIGLGHAYPAVIEAVTRELAKGCNFTRPSPIETECAEQFLRLIDADMVKFCKDGSTATTEALRLARAVTGRDLVACCGDHPFFATHDWFIGTSPMNAGIPEAVRKLTLTFRYNDIASVRALFEQHPGPLPALILGLPSIRPRRLPAETRRRARERARSLSSTDDHRLPLAQRRCAEGVRHQA